MTPAIVELQNAGAEFTVHRFDSEYSDQGTPYRRPAPLASIPAKFTKP